MISFPNGKINLGLQVDGKRADGYHDIDTLFYPIQINDVLEILPADEFKFSVSGLSVEGKAKDNLCVKAYLLLKNDLPELPAVNMFLHKVIPTGSGLGGGSSDAAFTLTVLNTLFRLGLSTDQLTRYAATLGSDCPFFIINQPCFASGRGEILKKAELALSAYSFLIVYPGIHINTDWAFSQLNVSRKNSSVKDAIAQPILSWKTTLKNDFEVPVFNKYPELRMIKEKLYEAGAVYASMSGSGSSFFGIFEKKDRPSIRFEKNFRVFIIK